MKPGMYETIHVVLVIGVVCLASVIIMHAISSIVGSWFYRDVTKRIMHQAVTSCSIDNGVDLSDPGDFHDFWLEALLPVVTEFVNENGVFMSNELIRRMCKSMLAPEGECYNILQSYFHGWDKFSLSIKAFISDDRGFILSINN